MVPEAGEVLGGEMEIEGVPEESVEDTEVSRARVGDPGSITGPPEETDRGRTAFEVVKGTTWGRGASGGSGRSPERTKEGGGDLRGVGNVGGGWDRGSSGVTPEEPPFSGGTFLQ